MYYVADAPIYEVAISPDRLHSNSSAVIFEEKDDRTMKAGCNEKESYSLRGDVIKEFIAFG